MGVGSHQKSSGVTPSSGVTVGGMAQLAGPHNHAGRQARSPRAHPRFRQSPSRSARVTARHTTAVPRDPLRRAATGHPGRAVAITSKVQAWGVGYAGRQCHSGCVADAAATARPAAACLLLRQQLFHRTTAVSLPGLL